MALALDRLLFKPLVRTMQERERAVKSAMDLANSATARAQAATAEFDSKLGAARAELYRQMDERRKAAEAYRTEVMAQTKAEVDASLAGAKTQLEQQTAQAKAQLEKDAESLGHEIARKVLGRTMTIAFALAMTAALGASEGGEAAGHGSPVMDLVAKLFNFGLLAGTLFYFGRGPLGEYLKTRGSQIRGDLVKAADMKTTATAQLAAIDQKMAALPAELDALRKTGAEEVAAEEARIRAAADAERGRLLTQMRREIDLHGKAAERDLVRVAAGRAIAAATAEITKTMTPADHARLVERYTEMVG